jgi:hypothetical protein
VGCVAEPEPEPTVGAVAEEVKTGSCDPLVAQECHSFHGCHVGSDCRCHCGHKTILCLSPFSPTRCAETEQCCPAAVGTEALCVPSTDSCPPLVSRREYKTDIDYLDNGDLQRLHDELMRYRLATWRYKGEVDGAAPHLGFIIDDVAPSASVTGRTGDSVDLYGYTSMAVAAMQAQAQEIESLRREIAALRDQVSHGRHARR